VLKAVGERCATRCAISIAGPPGQQSYAAMMEDLDDAEAVARRIEQAALSPSLRNRRHEIRLAAKPASPCSPTTVTMRYAAAHAEAALKRAKETGERYLFYAPHINSRVSEQVDLENRLRKAVDSGELFLHYQPSLDLASRRIVALEALMRWVGPDRVFVSPASSCRCLEQTGLILEAGRQALARASAAWRDWQARGLNPPRIAVNVSALQLRRKSFVEDVQSAIGGAGTDGGGIDIEITESLLMQEIDESIRKAARAARIRPAHRAGRLRHRPSLARYLSKLPVDT